MLNHIKWNKNKRIIKKKYIRFDFGWKLPYIHIYFYNITWLIHFNLKISKVEKKNWKKFLVWKSVWYEVYVLLIQV